METRKTTSKSFSPEVRARAVRMVQEHQGEHASQWAAISSIAAKIGCTAETLRLWVRRTERDQGKRAGLTTDERERLKALERENRELRQANQIFRKASAYFDGVDAPFRRHCNVSRLSFRGPREGATSMSDVAITGVDLAKRVFQLHVLRRRLGAFSKEADTGAVFIVSRIAAPLRRGNGGLRDSLRNGARY